jgi:hypothetical protein
VKDYDFEEILVGMTITGYAISPDKERLVLHTLTGLVTLVVEGD